MKFTCQNCGVTSDNSNNLCNPIDVIEDNLCGISADHFTTPSNTTFNQNTVCKDKLTTMKFFCAACGRQSANDELLCDPDIINNLKK
jgi:hypothetical protein